MLDVGRVLASGHVSPAAIKVESKYSRMSHLKQITCHPDGVRRPATAPIGNLGMRGIETETRDRTAVVIIERNLREDRIDRPLGVGLDPAIRIIARTPADVAFDSYPFRLTRLTLNDAGGADIAGGAYRGLSVACQIEMAWSVGSCSLWRLLSQLRCHRLLI